MVNTFQIWQAALMKGNFTCYRQEFDWVEVDRAFLALEALLSVGAVDSKAASVEWGGPCRRLGYWQVPSQSCLLVIRFLL